MGLGRSSTAKGMSRLSAGLHAHAHRVEIRVKAHADVLNIKEHEVDAVQHLRIGLARIPIETVRCYSGLRISEGAHFLSILRSSTDTVLWTK